MGVKPVDHSSHQISKRFICFSNECQKGEMLKTEESSKKCISAHPSEIFSLEDIFDVGKNQINKQKIDVYQQVTSDINGIKLKLNKAETLLDEVFFFQRLPEMIQRQDPIQSSKLFQLNTKLVIKQGFRTIIFKDQESKIKKLQKHMESIVKDFKELRHSFKSEIQNFDKDVDQLMFLKEDFPFQQNQHYQNITQIINKEPTSTHSVSRHPLPIKKSIEKQDKNSAQKQGFKMAPAKKYLSTPPHEQDFMRHNSDHSSSFSFSKIQEEVPLQNIILKEILVQKNNQEPFILPPCFNIPLLNSQQSQIYPPKSLENKQSLFREFPNTPNNLIQIPSQNEQNSLNSFQNLENNKSSSSIEFFKQNPSQPETLNLITQGGQLSFLNQQPMNSQPDCIIINSPLSSEGAAELLKQNILPKQSNIYSSLSSKKSEFHQQIQQEQQLINKNTKSISNFQNLPQNRFSDPQNKISSENYFEQSQKKESLMNNNNAPQANFPQPPQLVNQHSSKSNPPPNNNSKKDDELPHFTKHKMSNETLHNQELKLLKKSLSNNESYSKSCDQGNISSKIQPKNNTFDSKNEIQKNKSEKPQLINNQNSQILLLKDKLLNLKNHLMKKQLIFASKSLVVVLDPESKKASIYFELGTKYENEDEWSLPIKCKTIDNIKKIECKQMGKYYYLLVLYPDELFKIFAIDPNKQDLKLLANHFLQMTDFTSCVCKNHKNTLYIFLVDPKGECKMHVLTKNNNGDLNDKESSRPLKFQQGISILDSMESSSNDLGDLFSILLLIDKNNLQLISYSPIKYFIDTIKFDFPTGCKAYIASNTQIFRISNQSVDLIEKNNEIDYKFKINSEFGDIIKVEFFQKNIISYQRKGISSLKSSKEYKILKQVKIESCFQPKEQEYIFVLTKEGKLKAFDLKFLL